MRACLKAVTFVMVWSDGIFVPSHSFWDSTIFKTVYASLIGHYISLNVPVPYAILTTQVTVNNLITCNMVTFYSTTRYHCDTKILGFHKDTTSLVLVITLRQIFKASASSIVISSIYSFWNSTARRVSFTHLQLFIFLF